MLWTLGHQENMLVDFVFKSQFELNTVVVGEYFFFE